MPPLFHAKPRKWKKHFLRLQFLLQSLTYFISSFTFEPNPSLDHFIHSTNIYIFSINSFMGASISSTASTREKNNEESNSSSSKTGLGDIPESCISSILMNLDPHEICKLARVNRAFHRASSADFVWESKLPSCYKFLAHKFLGEENLSTMTKKDVYTKLCQPNHFDGGTKEVMLDKCSGQVCLFMSSKSLKITGIDDRRYWIYIPTEESR